MTQPGDFPLPQTGASAEPREGIEALHLSEATFAEILDIAADAIISIDEDQRIVLFNKGAEEIFGYPSDSVLGEPLGLLLPGSSREAHRAHVEEFGASEVRARRMAERQEISGRRKDGEEFPAEASISRIEVGGRRILTVLLRDVTERKRMESDRARALTLEKEARAEAEAAYERATRATRQRDEVLAMVTHDLRSPLNGILLGTSATLRRGALEEASRKRIVAIQSAADRMNRLLQDLLDVASIEGGRLSVTLVPTCPNDLVREATELLHSAPEEGAPSLQVDLPHDLPPILGDRDRLNQVLANLLSNAIRLTPEEGHVRVQVALDGGSVRFTVRDTGPGIPEAAFDTLFDRFWRPPNQGRGTGLGLAIARGIVEAHGGAIWVESEVGSGTAFHFTVPVAR